MLAVLFLGIGLSARPLPPAAMNSPFGVVCPWPDVGRDGMGAVWCRCGAGATRLGSWPDLEPLPGVFVWEPAEREWQAYYVREHLVPAPILGYTPQWASRRAGTPDGHRSPPADMWHYYRFCKAISRRFAGRIWFWEVWNEPNIGFFDGTIAEYVDMLKTAAVAIRAGNPKAYVVFGGMAGVDSPFLRRCYGFGAREYFDIMAAHPYQWSKTFDDAWFLAKVSALRRIMTDNGDAAKPIWLNEVGWSTASKDISPMDQARLLVQCYVTALSRPDLGIQRIFWFCVKDWGGPGYGLYADNGTRKPAWYAYRHMTRRLARATFAGSLNLGQTARAYVFKLGAADEWLTVAWATRLQPTKVTIPIAGRVLGAWDMLGRSVKLTSDGSALSLELPPEPLYIRIHGRGPTVSLSPPAPLKVALPDSPSRPPAWLSIYPQPGCSLPYLVKSQTTALRARLFNPTDRALAGELTIQVLEPRRRQVLGSSSVRAAAAAHSDARFSIHVPCPTDAPDRVLLRVRPRFSPASVPDFTTDAIVSDGPCVNFLANSYLERRWYLQPGAKSGCSESLRFGSEWTYRLPVPYRTRARVEMDVGAHRAGPWKVLWSPDGQQWQTLMEGHSDRARRSAVINLVEPPWLYLRCAGTDQQVGEVVVRYTAR